MTENVQSAGEIALALLNAENAHDVDGAVALFAENPIVKSSMDTYTTSAEVRRWQEELAENNLVIEAGDIVVEDNVALWDGTLALDLFRKMGLESLEGSWEITVENGKIAIFVFGLTQTALAKLQAAMEG